MDLNTCFETTKIYHTIAFYSHIVPIVLALFLSIYALIKTKRSSLSVSFFIFTLTFSAWLVGDLVTWTSSSYYNVYFFWSWLDYVNIVFFVLGSYFFTTLVKGEAGKLEKVSYLLLCVPAFVLTVMGNSVINFNQSVCEATNSDLPTEYKLIVEGIVVVFMLYRLFASWAKSTKQQITQSSIVFLAILLFFAVFASTEYLASISGIYEINLYGLFVLPIFLIVMVFAITNLGLFQFRFLGTQILAYVLLIVVGSQFLFIQDSTNRGLNIVTFVIALFLAYLLLQNAKKEAEQRDKIEKLNTDLQVANEGQENLIHVMNHQIKGYLAKGRNIFSELDTNPFYEVTSDKAKPLLQEGFKSLTDSVQFVQSILMGSSAQSGAIVHNMQAVDFKTIVSETADKEKVKAEEKGLKFELSVEGDNFQVNGDALQLKEAVRNLIDNSVIYTQTGGLKINLSVVQNNNKSNLLLVVQDTGIGISSEDKQRLFTKGGRGKDSMKVNVNSSGYGLAFVKAVVEAHKGRVWAESEGSGKGSKFSMELPLK